MQDTTLNVTTGNGSSVKRQKNENAAPRIALDSHSAFKPQRPRVRFCQKILALLSRVFPRRKAFLPKNSPVAPVPAVTMLLVHNSRGEAHQPPAAPLPAIACAGTDTAMRRMAEQQFAAMDVSQATMN